MLGEGFLQEGGRQVAAALRPGPIERLPGWGVEIGFFKHGWMILKWIVTIVAILIGTFYLGPWETNMMDISGKLGMEALSDPDYLYNQKMNLVFGTAQCFILMVTVFISIFKPWKKKKKIG